MNHITNDAGATSLSADARLPRANRASGTVGVLIGTLALVAVACTSGGIDFQIGGQSVQEAAVELIEDDLADDLGTELTAECPEVPDAEVGTEFMCTATTPEGDEIPVDAVIDREDHIALTAQAATPTSVRNAAIEAIEGCLLYTSPSPRDATLSRMPSSA